MSLPPNGWRMLRSATVYVDGDGRLVVTALADEVWPHIDDDGDSHPHNCDRMGCGSAQPHVVLRGRLTEGAGLP